MDGDGSWACEYLGRLSSDETKKSMNKIMPTSWRVLKTEAIDFTKDFLWLDDGLYE
jgi:hypothetical protein